MADVIDKNGYRANVGIVLMNQHKELFFAKRRYQSGWQFPQGGIKLGETPEHAMYRGQKQKWFLLKLMGSDEIISLSHNSKFQEFDSWKWVDPAIPARQVIGFKQQVYEQVLTEFQTFFNQ